MTGLHYWVFPVTPENWEIADKNKIWAVASERLTSLVRPQDFMILYVKGTNEFRGAYRFLDKWYKASEPIWADETESKQVLYPYQIKIEPIVVGRADVKGLVPKLRFIKRKDFPYWPLYLKGAPANMRNPVDKDDFELITTGMQKGSSQREVVVQPEEEEDTHTKMQYLLIQLGKLGKCDVWVAKNDRGKSYAKTKFENLCLKSLPNIGFSTDVYGLIENIDVLWLKGNMIMAAFEIEHTTSVYSGLLRLSDLVILVPNIKVQLFIVTPEKRLNKVNAEVNRPTFSGQFSEVPLNKLCRIMTYEDLIDTYEGLKDQKFPPTWRPDYITKLGEPCPKSAE